jgi:preprotein translocase subunit SecF
MLSGTYSSICIATPVLADLKEREPQYRALAKRVAQRAAGGRAAKRAGAKAAVGGGAAPAAGRAVADAGDDEPPADRDESEDLAGPSEPVPAGRASSRAVTPGAARPGQRQQPRRGNAARRRPGGKKKRR